MAQQTLINGNRYSFTSLTVTLNGIDQPRVFKSINYNAAQDPGMVQTNQVTVAGLTDGYATGSGSFEMLVSEWDDFNSQLTTNGTFPTMSVDFDVVVNYSVNDVDVRTDLLRGVRITSIDNPNQQGSDPTTKTCNIFIRRMRLNGIDAFADPTT